MKTLLGIIIVALLAALIGEYEARIGLQQELDAEVTSCDQYVAQHVASPQCKANEQKVWSEGEWECETWHPSNAQINSVNGKASK